ncbi:cysteine rich repeat-containing protein [Rhizobium sp. L1K21]|uniref:cysteine rich repeat-containing protein n=1 Tax=Rhizobium sp. L1K21 TaxID=2954933 RepID=UPI0020936F3E|nr:cysteine rich repeat-containing protein [Rhizobium sp. L1K21]MCO6185093.1 cysteine rich repeat-containing protein [Rhizobium sp. L1K21]
MKNSLLLKLAVIPSVFATPVFADSAQQISRTEMMKLYFACKADIDKFCSGIEPGEGRLAMCLGEHKADVSQTCIQAATPYMKDQKAD